MSVLLSPQGLSNPRPKLWVITVIVIIVLQWREANDIVAAYALVLEAVAAASAGIAVQQGVQQPR
ncbi:hypothetical protein [Streptomyces sp. NPDC058964]|uniref:hypothetical protein n=1 Tax=Streptomyces sp. NPDC058964 TaxID=3346681 RepID=UPI003690B454